MFKKTIIVKSTVDNPDQIIGQAKNAGAANHLLSKHIARAGIVKSDEIEMTDGTKDVHAYTTANDKVITKIVKFETITIDTSLGGGIPE